MDRFEFVRVFNVSSFIFASHSSEWWAASEVKEGRKEPCFVTWRGMILPAVAHDVRRKGRQLQEWEAWNPEVSFSIWLFQQVAPSTTPPTPFSLLRPDLTLRSHYITSPPEERCWWALKTELKLTSKNQERQFILLKGCVWIQWHLAAPPKLLQDGVLSGNHGQ